MHRETPIRRSLLQTGSPRAAENSNRHTVRIEFPVSYGKQRTGLSPNRYKKPDSFANFSKINRKPARIEFPVSHRKQRTGAQINRQLLSTLAARESGFPIPNTQHPKPCPACPEAGRESAACGDHIGQGPAARLRMPGHDLSFQNTCGAAMMLVKRMMPEAKFLRLRVFVLQRRLGVRNDAKTQVGKKQLGSFGTRAGLHGHEFFVRPPQRQKRDDRSPSCRSGTGHHIF